MAPPLLPDPTFRRLSRARDLAAARFNEPLPLGTLAAAASLSPYHFHRLFRSTYGMTPHDFVTMLRVDQARRLLAGDHSVTQTCLEVGFSSLGSFSARFRALTGLSPSGYRRELRRVFGSAAPLRAIYVPTCFARAFA